MKPNWESLVQFLNQRIKLDAESYIGASSAYQADRRRINRDRDDARQLIRWAQTWHVEPASVARQSSRLTWSDSSGWDYIPGQYYPVEVFGAVARAVARAILDHHMDTRLANPGINPDTGLPSPPPSISIIAGATIGYIGACGGPGSRRLEKWFT